MDNHLSRMKDTFSEMEKEVGADIEIWAIFSDRAFPCWEDMIAAYWNEMLPEGNAKEWMEIYG